MLWKILLRVTATRLRAAILQDLATLTYSATHL